MKKVFLGGTCNNSKWRDDIISKLKIDYFNPVVKDWTPECVEEEIKQRQNCTYCLYVITSEMTGVYSIAEVIDDSNKRPRKTIFCFLEEGFNEHRKKSLKQVGTMVQDNGGLFFNTIEKVINYLNQGV